VLIDRPIPESGPDASDEPVVVQRPLSVWERLGNSTLFRRLVLLGLLAALWEGYARHLDVVIMFPTLSETADAFWRSMLDGSLSVRVLASLKTLMAGYAIGVLAAAVLTMIAISSRVGTDLLRILTALFNPLPAIALLPLSLLWFGLGEISLVFVLVHAVLWPMALNLHSGFLGVGETLRMVGRNYGLRGPRFILLIMVPAAFPSILTGLKVSWAFAWRTLIAAEMVFGISSGGGGIGWFIYENRNLLETANVFAGLAAIILIGLLADAAVFGVVEARTVRRWGVQRS
jgi:NitT/TauT family transport system permease protein